MIIDETAHLEHYGVKGMKWGVRNDRRPAGVSRRTNRMAKKDAKESARAKMYYGDGAGTRRKLAKATVEQRRKQDPSYGKAYDHHASRQDMAGHASKARSERSTTDRKARNKQRRGAIARNITGEMGTQAAFVALAATGLAYAKSPVFRSTANQYARVAQSKVNEFRRRQGAKHISDLLDRMNPQ